MGKIYFRTLLLGGAFAAGMGFPAAAGLSGWIGPLIMVMLLVTFTKSNPRLDHFRKLHFVILAANFLTALGLFGLFRLLQEPVLAEIAFYTAIAPTAAAAPVIVGLLEGDTEFAALSVLLTNLSLAAAFPFLVILLGGGWDGTVFWKAAGSVVQVVICPAVLAGLLRRFFPKGAGWVCKFGQWNFFLWVTVLFLVAAKSSRFLRESQQSAEMLWELGALSFGICVLNFTLGYVLGRRELPRESSQVLGQKNTSLTLYLALQYASPVAALGPAFYIFWHNLWNAIQLHFHGRKKLISARNDARSPRL